MSLSINLNASAVTAHKNIANSGNAASKSIERLSSGYKINTASDDPAGLVISEKLRAQISGLGQAISNAGDAANMMKTAEGAMNETNTLLRSMRDLALHAANSGANDSAAVAADQAQIKSAIESLNNISSETQFGNRKLLDGTAGISTSTVNSSIVSADLSKATNLAKGNTVVTVDVTTAATQTTLTGKDISAGVGSAGTFYINGVGVDYASTDKAADLVTKVNLLKDQTGVTASTSADTKSLVLTSNTYGSAGSIVMAQDTAITAGATATAGVNAVATVKDNTGAVVGGTWAGTGLTLNDNMGNTITLANTLTAAATLTGGITVNNNSLDFQVGAYAGQTRTVGISSTAANKLGNTALAGKDVSTIDVTTTQGAQDAIKILDAAISQVSTQRASLGAFQKNVLDSTTNSLTVAKENISASESTIRDTDMAAEMTNFTKYNVLQQAGISMLSQANQGAQQMLSLLR